MDKHKKITPLKELNLTNRFLFDEVVEDPQTHQEILSIILGRQIPLLDKNETEKEIRISPALRSIRLDVFAMDENTVVYNTEMQQQKKNDLAKRSRHYQAVLDTSLLEPGILNYNMLNTSYIIIIMPFDFFGYGKYMYTFRNRCEEIPECYLEDGATKIFLNTRGENWQEVPGELVEFLQYIENSTDEFVEQLASERIKRIHQRVRMVKVSEEAGMRYLRDLEDRLHERQEGRQEGREEGREEGIRAVVRICKEVGFERNKILDELQKKFDVTEAEAVNYYQRFEEEEKIFSELDGESGD